MQAEGDVQHNAGPLLLGSLAKGISGEPNASVQGWTWPQLNCIKRGTADDDQTGVNSTHTHPHTEIHTHVAYTVHYIYMVTHTVIQWKYAVKNNDI